MFSFSEEVDFLQNEPWHKSCEATMGSERKSCEATMGSERKGCETTMGSEAVDFLQNEPLIVGNKTMLRRKSCKATMGSEIVGNKTMRRRKSCEATMGREAVDFLQNEPLIVGNKTILRRKSCKATMGSEAVDFLQNEQLIVGNKTMLRRKSCKATMGSEIVGNKTMLKRKSCKATMGSELKKMNERMIQRDAILNADTIEVKMIFGKQEVHFSNRRSCHGTKLLKSLMLALFFWPCAGGTGHGSGQPEHQSHSEIYPSTLNFVFNCPSRGEYMQRSLAKCADVCGSYMQDGNCAYHCMRDSSKTTLVEFCAKPKPLFDYCPEYDPVDQTIQKDLATLCNSTFSRNYYNSSDIYFCDPNNCLQLRESNVRSGATTLTTLMSETTDINDGDSQEWFSPLFVVLSTLLAVIIIGYIVFRVFVMRGIFSAHTRKMTEKRNQNGNQYAYKEEIITLG